MWWRRYIDDILVIWTLTCEEFSLFLTRLGCNDWNLAFMYSYPNTKLSFVDIRLQLQPDGSIYTTLFREKTTGNTGLHAKSFNPEHLKCNIPYSQYLRLKRNCTDDNDFHGHDFHDFQAKAKDLRDRLLVEGYCKKTFEENLSLSTGTEQTGLSLQM